MESDPGAESGAVTAPLQTPPQYPPQSPPHEAVSAQYPPRTLRGEAEPEAESGQSLRRVCHP